MKRVLNWFRLEPHVEDPPVRVWRDWLLVAAAGGTTIAEAIVWEEMLWRPIAVGLGWTLALTLLWRRTHPLTMVALGFGAFAVVDLASDFAAGEPLYTYAGAFVVVLVYSLFRWGTSRQAAIGSVIVLLEWFVSTATDFTGFTDSSGGLVLLLFSAALGVSIRYRHIVRTQQFEQVRFLEREMLARELHDTVAHHVSAIAIQAQAGQILAKSSDIDGAAEALQIIEKEASHTLAEMRSMVGSLRQEGGTAPIFTQRGVADIEALATTEGTPGLRIEVEHCGEFGDLRPSIQTALYRIAQESITNAKRHARHATQVHILVASDIESVRLSVSDNGERGPSNPRPPGYGLVGMTERVTLLGGTFDAGPRPERGWTVQATIPREGAPV